MPGSVALAWAGAIATALLFALIGSTVDTVAGDRPLDAATVTGMILLALAAAGFTGAGVWLSQSAASVAERRLRRLVVSRVFDLGVTGTAGRSGELLSLAAGAVERTAHYRATFLGPMLGALTTPLLVLIVMAVTVDLAAHRRDLTIVEITHRADLIPDDASVVVLDGGRVVESGSAGRLRQLSGAFTRLEART